MLFRNKPWLILVVIAALTLFALYAIDRFQHRFVRSDEDLLSLIPDGDSTIFFARVNLLRRAGMLEMIAGGRSTDPEYQKFVQATQFDYAKDIDALAGSVNERCTVIIVRGHLDWPRIEAYVRNQSGTCNRGVCALQSTKSGTWISMVRLQPDVVGVALGKERSLVGTIHPGQRAAPHPFPVQPIWMKLAQHLVKNPSTVPGALRIFLISLQPSNFVLLAVSSAPHGTGSAFEIELTAGCPSAAAADTVRKQLEIQTKMLKLELARQRQQPNPADLTGLLTSGTFDTSGAEVRGIWPVRKELLKTLQ